jgi:sugar O-acyltransferase (sialic acid O-acetyltransferase NeuD family)
MSKPGLILIGAGGHTHACIDVIEQCGSYQIAGLVGMPDEIHSQHLGYCVIATDNDLAQLAHQFRYAFIGIGQIKSPAIRVRLYKQLSEMGFMLPTFISPNAYVSRHAVVGAGSIIMHGAVVNAGAEVGDNCIINSRALIEHDARVADHCSISTGAILNGNTSVGTGSFVGSGSVIKQGIKLGDYCLVGMGLSIRRHHPDYSRILTDKS